MANIMRLGGGGGSKPKKLLSSLTEGSIISVLEDGKLTPFYVAKHNYEADLNGGGRTLLVRKELTYLGTWDTQRNEFNGSYVDNELNGEYFNSLSIAVKASSSTTIIEYTPSAEASPPVTTLAKNVFLLSTTELGSRTDDNNIEGEELPIASTLRIATLNGKAESQWTRSPHLTTSSLASVVTSSGATAPDYVSGTQGVRPCFTLPSAMALNEVPNADGTWTLADEVTIDTETASTTAKAGVNYTNGIADLTPAQLHEIAAAISANPNIHKYIGTIYYDKGDVHRKISTGDAQNITVNGTSYAVNIIGFNHDDLVLGTVYGSPTATGKAGMTFQLVNCLASKAMNGSNTNATGWTTSIMRSQYMQEYFATMISDLQTAIKGVVKPTSAGSKSSTITTTEDKLFLLSEVEVYGTTTYSFAGEGTQYAYYKAGNSKVKKLPNGNIGSWWERSPRNDNTTHFCVVGTDGNAATGYAGSGYDAAFAYCI